MDAQLSMLVIGWMFLFSMFMFIAAKEFGEAHCRAYLYTSSAPPLRAVWQHFSGIGKCCGVVAVVMLTLAFVVVLS